MFRVANLRVPEWNRAPVRSARRTMLKFCAVAVFESFLGLSSVCQQPTSPAPTGNANAAPQPQKPDGFQSKHKLGPLDIAADWRVRAEGWNWFESDSGDNDYAFTHSLLRISVGQRTEHFDWKLEGAQDSILALPSGAVVSAPQGQLGLGGTYYASNGNTRNNANGFVKQAYVTLKKLGPFNAQLGRFEFLDGIELMPKDRLLAALAQTRVSQRLIGNFGWSAVGRSFDGGHLTADWDANNVTFVASRPTRGVYQVDGMGELDINLFYGAYTHIFAAKGYSARLRSFGIGYVDQRNSVLKTDNRPATVRAADHNDLQIGTYGGELLQVFDVEQHNKIDVILWGVWQNGSWGVQTQRASAFIIEAGWQAGSVPLNPWVSFGFSHGSGDKNPNDATHNTFFQILPTPRPYARFPFFNMQNNDDFYASTVLQPNSKLSLRSELHALRLASAADLWYLGGGAFQPRTFGYTGRPSNGNRSLANVWDLSGDYQVTKMIGLGLYYGHAWGKSVIQSIYPRDANGQIAYLETNVRF
jgi:Alginate export